MFLFKHILLLMSIICTTDGLKLNLVLVIIKYGIKFSGNVNVQVPARFYLTLN